MLIFSFGRLIFDAGDDGARERDVVVHERDLGAGLLRGDEFRRRIAPADGIRLDAERVMRAGLGELRKGRDRHHERHLVLLGITVDGERDVGAGRAGQRQHVILDVEAARRRHRLRRIGLVVDELEVERPADHAALGGDLLLRIFDALAAGGAEERVRPAQFGDDADRDRRAGLRPRRQRSERQRCASRCDGSDKDAIIRDAA